MQEKSLVSEYELDEQDQRRLNDEMAKWKYRLNVIVAPMLFAVSGTFVTLVRDSRVYGSILLVFACTFMGYIVLDFPKTIQALREKKNKTIREIVILNGVVWKHFGWRGLLQYAPYLLSWFFMTIVAVGGLFGAWLP